MLVFLPIEQCHRKSVHKIHTPSSRPTTPELTELSHGIKQAAASIWRGVSEQRVFAGPSAPFFSFWTGVPHPVETTAQLAISHRLILVDPNVQIALSYAARSARQASSNTPTGRSRNQQPNLNRGQMMINRERRIEQAESNSMRPRSAPAVVKAAMFPASPSTAEGFSPSTPR